MTIPNSERLLKDTYLAKGRFKPRQPVWEPLPLGPHLFLLETHISHGPHSWVRTAQFNSLWGRETLPKLHKTCLFGLASLGYYAKQGPVLPVIALGQLQRHKKELFMEPEGWQFFTTKQLTKVSLILVASSKSRIGCSVVYVLGRSVIFDSLQSHGLLPARLLCPWDSPGRNTGVGCHFLLQGSSQHKDQSQVSHVAGWLFTVWANREVTRTG